MENARAGAWTVRGKEKGWGFWGEGKKPWGRMVRPFPPSLFLSELPVGTKFFRGGVTQIPVGNAFGVILGVVDRKHGVCLAESALGKVGGHFDDDGGQYHGLAMLTLVAAKRAAAQRRFDSEAVQVLEQGQAVGGLALRIVGEDTGGLLGGVAVAQGLINQRVGKRESEHADFAWLAESGQDERKSFISFGGGEPCEKWRWKNGVGTA